MTFTNSHTRSAKAAGKIFILLGLSFFLSTAGRGAAEMAADRVREIAAMLPAQAEGVARPITHRPTWEALAAKPDAQPWLASVTKQAATPSPEISDELYLDYSKTGNRDRWQNAAFARRNRIGNFALAELLENKGRFLPPLEETIRSVCAEKTWVYPAHDRNLKNFHGTATDIDLGSVHVARELATADYMLGDKLSPKTRLLIRQNLQRRIFQPFRDMGEGKTRENHWMRGQNNWNAVCLSGVTAAALAILDSREERAWFVAAAEYYIQNFLAGFTPDGYCSEGLGYWNYGFGNFIELSEVVRQATGGKLDWLAQPAAQAPAFFWKKIEILNDIYPSIADCHPGSRPNRVYACYLCRRFDTPQLAHCPEENSVSPMGNLFSNGLFSSLPKPLPVIQTDPQNQLASPHRSWFPDGGVLICRNLEKYKVDFAASLKGGHNGEQHNHNDLGSFIVVAGKSTPLIDPGAEVYTARTFGKNRYDSDVLNSFGHMVPVVAGKLQRTGRNAQAKIVRTNFSENEDTLVLDLRSAYAVPELLKLERSFTFRRGEKPSLVVTDEVEFKEPKTFETALVTWSDWKKLSPTELLFPEAAGAVRVKIDSGGNAFSLKPKKLEADVRTTQKPVRVGLALEKPVLRAKLTVTISPEQSVAKAVKK